jgi:DNA-directed RNA polymerase specialized sigma24 family protein
MQGPRTGWFLDARNTCDEVLLLLAREADCQPARDELTCRYWCRFKINLRRWAMPAGLVSGELEDAQQEAFFWIQQAIRCFDAVQLSRPGGASFQTFLKGVFRVRLRDFFRSVYRRNRRFRLSGDPERWPQSSLTNDTRDSPERLRELSRQVAVVVADLDHQARALWDELCRGKCLRDLPQILGVSYRTVKRAISC